MKRLFWKASIAALFIVPTVKAQNFSNAVGGNWNVASNWSSDSVPTSSSTANLNALSGPYTVQITDTQGVNILNVTSANVTLNQTGNFTANAINVNAGTFNFSTGNLSFSSLAISAGATANWSGGTIASAGTLTGTLVASGGSKNVSSNMQINGTLAWTGGAIFDTVGYGPTFTIAAGGTIDLQTDGTAFDLPSGFSPVGGYIVNNGTLLKSGTASTPTSSIINWAVTLANGGTINVQTGTLNLNGGGTLPGGTTTIMGAGIVNLSGGTFTVTSGQTFTAASSGGAYLNWTGGTITTGSSAGTIAGTLIASSGMETCNSSNLQIGGTLAMTGGTIVNQSGYGPTLTIIPGGTVDFRIDGTAFAIASGSPSAGYLVNYGTLLKSGTSSTPSSSVVNWAVTLANGGAINVAVGTLNFNGGGTLASGTTTISGAGTVALNSGTFTVASGQTFTAASSGGAYLNWTGGTLTAGTNPGTLAGTLIAGTGTNTKEISGSTLQIGGTLVWTGGTIYNPGGYAPSFTVVAGGTINMQTDGIVFDYADVSPTGGSIVNYGTFYKSGAAPTPTSSDIKWTITLNGGGALDVAVGTLNFDRGGTLGSGTTTISGAGIAALNAGTFTVTAQQTFTAAGSGGAYLNWTGGTLTAGTNGTFAGTLIASSGTKTISGTSLQLGGTLACTGGTIYNASGTVCGIGVLSNGIIDLRTDGPAFALVSASGGNGGTIINLGTFQKSGTSGIPGTSTVGWAITNSGTIQNIVGATLNFAGGVTNTGTVTMINGATIGGSITSNGGIVEGPPAAPEPTRVS